MGFAPTDDGHEIYYELQGTTGLTPVLVSGYMGIANIWQPLLAKLGPKYRCIILDETIALEAAKWPSCARRDNARALLSFEIGDMYSTVDVPGLIIQGAKDMATPVEGCVRPIQQAMPSYRLEVLGEVRHFPPPEAPSEVKRLIDEFVRTLL